MATDLRCPNCEDNLGKDKENDALAYCGTCGESDIYNEYGYTDDMTEESETRVVVELSTDVNKKFKGERKFSFFLSSGFHMRITILFRLVTEFVFVNIRFISVIMVWTIIYVYNVNNKLICNYSI